MAIDPAKLRALADRAEAGSGKDRALDRELFAILIPNCDLAPYYTSSFDAARGVSGWKIAMAMDGDGAEPSTCVLWKAGHRVRAGGQHPTDLTRALLAAELRARAMEGK